MAPVSYSDSGVGVAKFMGTVYSIMWSVIVTKFMGTVYSIWRSVAVWPNSWAQYIPNPGSSEDHSQGIPMWLNDQERQAIKDEFCTNNWMADLSVFHKVEFWCGKIHGHSVFYKVEC